jgi:hypothetical protein
MNHLISYKSFLLEQNFDWRETVKNQEKAKYNVVGDLGLDWDDLVDVCSALAHGIPGLGTLVGVGIDLGHLVSFAVRFSMLDSENPKEFEKKIYYLLQGLIILATIYLPTGSGPMSIILRQGVKKTLAKTPFKVVKIAKKLGLFKGYPNFDLSKNNWKFSILLFLVRYLGGEFSEIMSKKIAEGLKTLKLKLNEKLKEEGFDKIDFLNTGFDDLIDIFDLMSTYRKDAEELNKKIDQEWDKPENRTGASGDW